MEYFEIPRVPWGSVSVTAELTSAMFMMLFLSVAPHESSSSRQKRFTELVVLFPVHTEIVLPMSWEGGPT